MKLDHERHKCVHGLFDMLLFKDFLVLDIT